MNEPESEESVVEARGLRGITVVIGLLGLMLSSCAGGHRGSGASIPPPAQSSSEVSSPPQTQGSLKGSPPPRGLRWILAGSALQKLEAAGGTSLARQAFGDARTFLVVARMDQIPAGWGSVPTTTFSSYRDLSAAVGSGGLDPRVRAIMYDNEAWQFTPADEQRDPASYAAMAAADVHRRGLLFISAPAVDLVTVLRPGQPSRYQAYLDLGLAASGARSADVFDIQAQGTQNDPGEYAQFVTGAAQQARAANPSVTVLAGLSTGPSGQQTSPQQLLAAVTATRGIVDGYWLNIPQRGPRCPSCGEARPDIALQLLELLVTPAK